MRTYMGILILNCDRNASGMKYYAYTESGKVIADTLSGIKNRIKKSKKG